MKEIQQIITAVTEAYEQGRYDLIDADINNGVHRAISSMIGDLAMYEWRVEHGPDRKGEC